MTRHSYPSAAMFGDYFRAASGFVPLVAILGIIPVGPGVAVALTGLAGLFLLFGIRTALRHATRFELAEAALHASGPAAKSIAWSDLDSIKLAYYSTRRDRGGGWMQLDLRAGRRTVRLDSRIEDFTSLVERAARAAYARGLPLDRATAGNLRALGIEAPEGAPVMLEARGTA